MLHNDLLDLKQAAAPSHAAFATTKPLLGQRGKSHLTWGAVTACGWCPAEHLGSFLTN